MPKTNAKIDPSYALRLLSRIKEVPSAAVAADLQIQPSLRLSCCNVAHSPVSLHVASAILAAGSFVGRNTRCRERLLSFFAANSSGPIPNPAASSLAMAVTAPVDSDDSDAPSVYFANTVWIRDYLLRAPMFMWECGRHRSLVQSPDISKKPTRARKEANEWMLAMYGLPHPIDMIPRGSVSKDTEFLVCNSLCFIGQWEEKLELDDGCSEFYMLDGRTQRVSFMTSDNPQYIACYPKHGFKVLRLPYRHGKDPRRFAMYIFLPDARDGLFELEDKLAAKPGFLERHLPKKLVPVGDFKVPVQNYTHGGAVLGAVWPPRSATDDEEIGEAGALVEPFDSYGFSYLNFPGFKKEWEQREPTVRRCTPTSGTRMDFVADHPFAYVIREETTKTVVLTGHVSNPLCGSCHYGVGDDSSGSEADDGVKPLQRQNEARVATDDTQGVDVPDRAGDD